MKLTIVGQDFAGGQGVDYVTVVTARMFAKAGWMVEVLVSQVHADYLREGKKPFELPPEVKLIYMPSRRGSRNGWFMRKYLKTCGSDFVIAESGIYSWCIRWASIGIPRRCLPRLVQVVHGNVYPLRRNVAWENLVYWFKCSKYYAVFFVNNKSEVNFRQRLRWVPGVVTATVGNAVIDKVAIDKMHMPPKHPWLINKKCPTFVIAGAYVPLKRHLVAIEAMSSVVRKRSARLIVFGRGVLESEYKEYVVQHGLENVVSIAGYTDQLQSEVFASDGLLSASTTESFGITLVEALACGKPVIATDAPYGPREILGDGKYGRLVPVNNPEAMAEAIVDCIDGKIPCPPNESWRRYTIDATMQKYLAGIGLA